MRGRGPCRFPDTADGGPARIQKEAPSATARKQADGERKQVPLAHSAQ